MFGCVEDKRNDSRFCDVLCYIYLRVVSTHLFLVDVLLEDVTKYARSKLIVLTWKAIIQLPGAGVEECEDALKSLVGYADGGEVVALYLMFLEEINIEERYVAEKGGLFRYFCLFAQSLEEEDQKEVAIEVETYVLAILDYFQMVRKVVCIMIKKSLVLDKVEEHQTREQQRGVTGPVSFSSDTFDACDEDSMFSLEAIIEAFGDAFDGARSASGVCAMDSVLL